MELDERGGGGEEIDQNILYEIKIFCMKNYF